MKFNWHYMIVGSNEVVFSIANSAQIFKNVYEKSFFSDALKSSA